MKPLAGIVLAGGRSSRLGRDKAEEMLGGKTLLQRAIDALSPLCVEVIIVGRKGVPSDRTGVRRVEDIVPDMGPLGGIYTGLSVTRQDQNLVVACDMPFLKPDLLRSLAEGEIEADAVVPVVDGQAQPLCARYALRCLHAVDSLIRAGHYSVMKLFPLVRTAFVELDDPQPFLDIDTEDDLHRARKMAGE